MNSTRGATLNLARARLVASLTTVVGLLLAAALFLTALFSNRRGFGVAGEIALVASLLGLAAAQGLWACFVFRSGSWRTLAGKLVSRQEQPTRFMTLVALQGTFAAIWIVVAGFLMWSLLAPRF